MLTEYINVVSKRHEFHELRCIDEVVDKALLSWSTMALALMQCYCIIIIKVYFKGSIDL